MYIATHVEILQFVERSSIALIAVLIFLLFILAIAYVTDDEFDVTVYL